MNRPILVAHDDADVRAVIVADLRADGHDNILTAPDGEQALAMACQVLPALLVADIHMPGLDGFQLVQVLRAQGGAGVPVILISASYRDPAAARLAGDLGAAAYVEAPYRPEALRAAVRRVLASDGRPATTQPSARLLVVEDEPDIAAVIRATLVARGYMVECAEDAPSAMAAMERFRPDLLVLDYQLPGMTGLDLLRQMQGAGHDVAAVVLSAHADMPLTVEFVRAGAEEVMAKPFQPGRLLSAIGRALERRALWLRASQFRERLDAAKRSEARVQSLVDMSRDVICHLDADGRITSTSPSTAALTGKRREDLAGTLLVDLFAPDSRTALARALAPTVEGEEFDADLLGADGGAIPVSVRIQPVRLDGRFAGHWLVARDLRRQRDLSRKLADAEKRQGMARLVAGVSHEFSGMVGGMMGMAELALRAPTTGAPLAALARIRDTAARAAELLDELRALGWAERGDDRIDPGDLAREAVHQHAGAFAAAGVRLTLEVAADLPTVAGRRPTLARALRELLSNARHACVEAGSEKWTRVTVQRGVGGTVEWRVDDDGRGVPAESLARLFEPFFTTKGALGGRVHEGKVHGTGLGLPIARAIAEAHGGRLTLANRPAGGVTATLVLPTARPTSPVVPAMA